MTPPSAVPSVSPAASENAFCMMVPAKVASSIGSNASGCVSVIVTSSGPVASIDATFA